MIDSWLLDASVGGGVVASIRRSGRTTAAVAVNGAGVGRCRRRQLMVVRAERLEMGPTAGATAAALAEGRRRKGKGGWWTNRPLLSDEQLMVVMTVTLRD